MERQPGAIFCRLNPLILQSGALPPTWLTPTLFVIGANRDRLQRRFDQAEGNTQIVQPVLNFLFHRHAPFRVVLSVRNSEAASH